MATTTHHHGKQSRIAWLLATGISCLGVISPAMADVIEVSANGSTMMRFGAGAVKWIGVVKKPVGGGEDIEVPADVDVPVFD